jgi:hypothetical protein
MNQIYEVTLKYTALVLAKDSQEAERVAREEEREITGDDNAQIDAGVSIRSEAELYAWAALEQQGWDTECCPYGGDKSIGGYLAEIEQADAEEAATAKCLSTTDMFATPEPERPPSFQMLAARKNANAGDDWQWASMEWIGNGDTGGCLIEGGVPNIDHKGRARWTGVALEKVFVTPEQERAQRELYRKQTGKCDHCAGSGQRDVGWSHDVGNKYAPCEPCGATGKPHCNDAPPRPNKN